MRLEILELEGFRRIENAKIQFAASSFIVGQNNTSKSSVIAAIEALLSLEKEKFSQSDIHTKGDGTRAAQAILTAHFSGISADIAASRGFKGRVIDGRFIYRKSLGIDSTKVKIETQEYPSTIKQEFRNAKTVTDLMDAGIDQASIKETLELEDPAAKLPKNWHKSLPDVLEFDTQADPIWVENPGGIPQNVLSKLPRLIHIPALTEAKEIESDERKYPLGECLALLFEDLVNENPVAQGIQSGLNDLQKQMDPTDEDSLIHDLVKNINKIIDDVFPACGIKIEPSLQDLLSILRPKYSIQVFSNIPTSANRQGTGLVRTCVFAMLRYHAKLKLEKDLQTRPILVAFEEPELFLHPSAANLLRETIYTLGTSDQIVCTTHSPWMIDLSKDLQSITRMQLSNAGQIEAINYGVSATYGTLPPEDKARVKMVQFFDDEMSRIFFSDHVVVVEGDSEALAIKNSLKLLSGEERKRIAAAYQVVRARGKASIISVVKYLRALNLDIRVMHDSDKGVEGAEKFNKPIADALGDKGRKVILEPNLETALGYAPPSNDKPFKAFEKTQEWKELADMPVAWGSALRALFDLKV